MHSLVVEAFQHREAQLLSSEEEIDTISEKNCMPTIVTPLGESVSLHATVGQRLWNRKIPVQVIL